MTNFLRISYLVLLNLMNENNNGMLIHRPSISTVDFYEESHEKISYCSHCLEYNIQVPLKNRIYPEGQPIPVDHDSWVQCHECGSIFSVNEIQKEPTIKNIVEKLRNLAIWQRINF